MSQIPADIERVLLTEDQIQKRVGELAAQISRDYASVDNLVMIGVLKGAFMFLSDLARRLEIPRSVDFIAVTSYGKSAHSSGEVRFIMDLREPTMGKHVLLVEDIVDSGHTLAYLHHTLQGRHPASLRTAALVRKSRRSMDVHLDYLGFEIPDVWVVGYGLDYADQYRTLPYIAELKKSAYEKPGR